MISEQIKAIIPQPLHEALYIGEFPTDRDDCVVITESGGPHGTYFAKDQMDTPIIKISVRALDYLQGYRNAKAIKEALTSYSDAQTLAAILIGDVMYFGRDEKRRNVFQLTYKVFSYLKV